MDLNVRYTGHHKLGHAVYEEVQRVLREVDADQALIQGSVADDLHAAVEAALIGQVETTITDFIAAL